MKVGLPARVSAVPTVLERLAAAPARSRARHEAAGAALGGLLGEGPLAALADDPLSVHAAPPDLAAVLAGALGGQRGSLGLAPAPGLPATRATTSAPVPGLRGPAPTRATISPADLRRVLAPPSRLRRPAAPTSSGRSGALRPVALAPEGPPFGSSDAPRAVAVAPEGPPFGTSDAPRAVAVAPERPRSGRSGPPRPVALGPEGPRPGRSGPPRPVALAPEEPRGGRADPVQRPGPAGVTGTDEPRARAAGPGRRPAAPQHGLQQLATLAVDAPSRRPAGAAPGIEDDRSQEAPVEAGDAVAPPTMDTPGSHAGYEPAWGVAHEARGGPHLSEALGFRQQPRGGGAETSLPRMVLAPRSVASPAETGAGAVPFPGTSTALMQRASGSLELGSDAETVMGLGDLVPAAPTTTVAGVPGAPADVPWHGLRSATTAAAPAGAPAPWPPLGDGLLTANDAADVIGDALAREVRRHGMEIRR